MTKNSICCVIVSFLFTAFAAAGTVTKVYNFDSPEILNQNGESVVNLHDCWTTGVEGEPLLPIMGGGLLLPPSNGAVEIICRLPDPVSLGTGYYVPPVQAQHPLSAAEPFPPTPENRAIYDSNALYPEEPSQNLQTHFASGYSIAYFTLHPVIYNPQSGEISYYPWMEVTIECDRTPEAEAAHMTFYRGLQADRMRVEAKTDNPSLCAVYGEVHDGTDDDEATLLIITDQELQDSFEALAEYKRIRGTLTEIVLKEWILSNYSGIDAADQIRNCIIDYYTSMNTEYVLLAGDVENIPKRGLYATVGGYIDYDMAADLYFGCLDGTWDDNNNGIWGEPSEADLVAEVYVGRAGVDSPSEAERFINKQIAYQHTPVADELTNALMLGEDLEWNVWGSAYKEEIRLGSSNWGYTTVGFPPQFEVETLYDEPGYHWSAMTDLLPLLNQGPQLVNHLGHANNTYALKFGGVNVNDIYMTNDGINHNFYIIYSQGCYCNSWDNRLPNGATTGSDAIAEAWTSIANGAVCFIGNTRYGWGSYSNTNGSSQYYDREFFDAVFGEGIYQIGYAHQDSKEDCIPFINYSANRWCYYECCLLGDPTLEIWTDVPQPMTVDCDTFVNFGDTEFSLEVAGLSGAICAISQNGQLLGSAVSGPSGSAVISFSDSVSITDPLRLVVTKHDYYPFDMYLIVYVPNAPNMILNQVTVNDLQGDGDGILDLGEEPFLNLTVTNFGGVDAQSAYAAIETDDWYVDILDGGEALGTIAHDLTLTFEEAFQVQVQPDVPDEHIINFELIITDASENSWDFEFSLPVSAPVVILTDVELDDGDDMRLSAGETAEISVTLSNIGSGEARLLEGCISTDNPYLEINQPEGASAFLEAGQAVELTPPFSVSAASNCPASANIPIYLTLTDDMGYLQSQMFEIIVGGIMETFENGVGEWTHEAITAGWGDQWIMTDYRNYTPGGEYCWHCGPGDGSNYADNLDAGLITPEYEILDGATLTFRHWMNGETSQSNPGYCYDGGIVEMKLDTCVFIQIFPMGGYNYYIRDNPDMGPFITSCPVYSGEIIWEEAVFDLDPYPNWPARFRFRFGSNSAGNREGWYIDDVEITYMAPIQPPTNYAGVMSDSVTVHLSWNSPESGSLSGKSGQREIDGLLGYRVYRNDEPIADNVGALWYDDDLRPLPSGLYSYQVTALFTKGESPPTEPAVFEWVDLSVSGHENEIPVDYFAEQNYPNPFNPETRIRYGLPEPGQVKIAVYNILGREVAVLADDFKSQGIHTAVWKADNQPSGIYFYYLQAGDEFNAKGKMLLLK